MTQREDKQQARTSREELGKFFYNLAAMCFGTTVLGSGMALVTDTGNPERLLGMFAGGIIGTIALAYAAFRIIKIKYNNYETAGFYNRYDLGFWHYCINCSCYKYLAFYQMG